MKLLFLIIFLYSCSSKEKSVIASDIVSFEAETSASRVR